MKNLTVLFAFILVSFSGVLYAQKTHTVGPKETFYSIGRDYQVHPRELADYNKMDIDKGLKIGQVIKIPAAKRMSPSEKKSGNQKIINVPIYHTVKKQENLFKVRMQYNKVPMDSLKKWNNLTSDNVKEGTRLIVGYSNTTSSPSKTENTLDIETPTIPEKPKIVETPVAEIITETNTAKSDTTNVIFSKEKALTFDSLGNQIIDVSLEELQKKNTTDSISKIISEPAPAQVKNEEGFFRPLFITEKATHQETGMAASFKSTSGWDDGRYYCLHNSAPVGSIIKITNNVTQKTAYAKVLDGIPDLDANKNIAVRISKAMAEKLGITTDQTEVSILY